MFVDYFSIFFNVEIFCKFFIYSDYVGFGYFCYFFKFEVNLDVLVYKKRINKYEVILFNFILCISLLFSNDKSL